MTELLPSSSGGVGGRGVLPTSSADVDYNSSSSARPGGLSGGGIGNSGRASKLGSSSGTRSSRLLSRQEEGLSGGEILCICGLLVLQTLPAKACLLPTRIALSLRTSWQTVTVNLRKMIQGWTLAHFLGFSSKMATRGMFGAQLLAQICYF